MGAGEMTLKDTAVQNYFANAITFTSKKRDKKEVNKNEV